MNQITSEIAKSVKQPGRDAGFVQALMSNPVYGFLMLFLFVVEFALFILIVTSSDPIQRYVSIGAFAALAIVALIAFVYVRRSDVDTERMKLDRQRTHEISAPESMVVEPVEEAEAEVEINGPVNVAPDSTFLYADPPANWDVEITSLQDIGKAELEQQGLEMLVEGAFTPPFKPGPVAAFNERQNSTLSYTAGLTAINERLTITLFDEVYCDQVTMFSISKSSVLMKSVTLPHIFSQLVAMLLAGGSKIVEISEELAGSDERPSISVRAEKTIEKLSIDDVPTEKAVLEIRLSVVEHEAYFYVIQTRFLAGRPGDEDRKKQIEDIVGSFRVTRAANTQERLEADQKDADQNYETLLETTMGAQIAMRAQSLLGEMIKAGGQVYVSDEAMARMQKLVDQKPNYEEYVDQDLIDILDEFYSATLKARDGDPQDLQTLAEGVGLN